MGFLVKAYFVIRKVFCLFALERRKRILELLNQNGSVLVNDLSRDLQVTVETIRRDLEKLEQSEQLTRTHGGAVPFEESNLDLSLEKRRGLNIEGKIAIARKAVNHIRPGDTIFLDGSTTSYYLSKQLKDMKNITIITNNLQILEELSGCDKMKVISTGGVLDVNNQSFVGEVAVDNINKNFCANKIFFSSKGMTMEQGILESNDVEFQIKRAMLNNSMTKFLLLDKSKLEKVGFIKLSSFSEIDMLFTDEELSEDWKKILKKNKVTVE